MTPDTAHLLAACLAALGAAALVCGAFLPSLYTPSGLPRRLAAVVAQRKAGQEDLAPSGRNIRRAQDFALKAIAETKRGRRATRLDTRMTAAGLRWRQEWFWGACVTLGAVLFGVARIGGLPFPTAAVAALMGAWFLPQRWLLHMAKRRRQKFIAGFAPAVDMIVRGVRSGQSVADCLNMVAADAAQPVRKEFGAVVAQLRAGVPISEAMAKLSTAMPAPELRFFATVMAMQSQTGGNLSEALGNLAKVLRDRQRLATKVRTASAEVKASAIAVGSLPFVVTGATSLLSPDYISLLWTDPTGRNVTMISLGWLCLGIAVLRRMARIHV